MSCRSNSHCNMEKALQSQIVAAVSFIVNYLFFYEYLPPFKRVHIPFDLDGFHFPLVDYAFRSLRQGRFPEWDPSIYCGLSFVGNIQAALFYPITWVLFAANLGRERVLYVSLEILVILHVWLAFLLCFLWLRWKGLLLLPSVFGGAVLAYSGYMLMQLQHQGVVIGYAWMPLGLWAIDQAVKSQSWRPLWKLAPPRRFASWPAIHRPGLYLQSASAPTLSSNGAGRLSRG